MQNKNHWYRIFRFKLFAVLCTIAVLASAVFVSQPARASEAAANPARPAYTSPSDTDLSVISSRPGYLEVFAIKKSDSTIAIRSYQPDDDGIGYWGASWGNLGKPAGTSFEAVEAVSRGTGLLDVFGTTRSGNTFTLWHKYWNGSTWGAWESLGGGSGAQFYSGVQAVSWGSGRIDIFTTNQGTCSYYNNCWSEPVLHKWFNGSTWGPSQTGWESMGEMYGSLQVVSHSANRLNLFSTDNYYYNESYYSTYHQYWNGSTWLPSISTWYDLNKSSQDSPYAVSWGPNRLDLFVRGTDGKVWQTASNNGGGSWQSWYSLGGSGSDEVSAEAWGNNRLDIFENRSGAIYHKWWDGVTWMPAGTADWEHMGTNIYFNRAPEVVSFEINRLDLFERIISSGEVFYKSWNGSTWIPSTSSAWASLGTP